MAHGCACVRNGDRLAAHHEVIAWLGSSPGLHEEHCPPPTPALPGAHASHGVVVLLALRCLPASHLMHALCDTLKYAGYLHSSQLERCLLGRLPAVHAAQRLPLDDTSTPLQATLQKRRREIRTQACDAWPCVRKQQAHHRLVRLLNSVPACTRSNCCIWSLCSGSNKNTSMRIICPGKRRLQR